MSLDRINLLNIGLMVGSCAAALWLPFHLFLLAYVLLGPLHYLTQISWLHTRGYFTTSRWDALALVVCCAALTVVNFVPLGLRSPNEWGTTLIGIAFAGACVMSFVANPYTKAVGIGAAFLTIYSVSDWPVLQVWLVVFLPAIIHVYLFTAAFVLHGALKHRSASAAASLAVFVACTVVVFVLPAEAQPASIGDPLRRRYEDFSLLNLHLSAWLPGPALAGVDDVYGSATGVRLMRLIAFAYTYHYLNWFSKTSVIQWHKIPPAWTAANLGLWLAALALYAWNFETGLSVLFVLSYLHVFLEFPLDHRTFVGIGRELRGMVGPPVVPAPASRAARRRHRHSR